MDTEDKFLIKAKHLLDSMGHAIDDRTSSRLRNARLSAIDQGLHKPMRVRPGWLIPVGSFAIAGIALAVLGLLWFSAPNGNFVQAGISDIDLLTARESPEFFTELEFYEWLEGDGNAG